MREMGIAGLTPGPNTSKPAPQHPIYPYLLRNVTAAYPNHIWGIDITYIPLKAGWQYLVAVLDWFSSFIVGWQLSQTLELDFVLKTVDEALLQAVSHIWNSDQAVSLPARSISTACWPPKSRSAWMAEDAPEIISSPSGCGIPSSTKKESVEKQVLN